jgi:hypothetical protein
MAVARQQDSTDTSTSPAKGAAKSKTTAAERKPSSKSSKTSDTHTSSSGKRSSKKKSAKARGQQKIDSERAQAIQEALIREHYLVGEASGTWNQSSEEAMRRYQADQGWQTKQVPDSRALIKLGLGPNKDHLLNPESAMTTGPDAARAESRPPTPALERPAPPPTPAPARAPN